MRRKHWGLLPLCPKEIRGHEGKKLVQGQGRNDLSQCLFLSFASSCPCPQLFLSRPVVTKLKNCCHQKFTYTRYGWLAGGVLASPTSQPSRKHVFVLSFSVSLFHTFVVPSIRFSTVIFRIVFSCSFSLIGWRGEEEETQRDGRRPRRAASGHSPINSRNERCAPLRPPCE